VAPPFAVQERSDGGRLYVYDKAIENHYVVVDPHAPTES
jgi:hypothetical protein